MAIGLLTIECFLSQSLSLKDKRRILTGLFERLRRSFNLAVCEVESQDQWQRARLAVVMVNTEWRMIQSNMSKVLEIIERDGRIQVTQTELRQLG
ncbi:MAG: DUF503 domain-containing protein [candidate division WOR-3 bacterium]